MGSPFPALKSDREHSESRPLQRFSLPWSLRRKVFPGNRLLTICKVNSPFVRTQAAGLALWFT